MKWFLLFYVSICSVFKNEAPYLKEWIEFHRLVGVEHFYLYDNNSEDSPLEVLQPYIDQKVVEYRPWHVHYKNTPEWLTIQCCAFNDCLAKSGWESRWIAFLDIDEFLFPVVKNNLVEFLSAYEPYGGVAVNWVVYGTSHIYQIPPGALLVESLILRKHSEPHSQIKSVVQPALTQGFLAQPHYPIFKPGVIEVNPNFNQFKGPLAQTWSVDKIRINHYWTRDINYLFNYKMPRYQNWLGKHPFTPEKLNQLNEVVDTAIFRFIPGLKARM